MLCWAGKHTHSEPSCAHCHTCSSVTQYLCDSHQLPSGLLPCSEGHPIKAAGRIHTAQRHRALHCCSCVAAFCCSGAVGMHHSSPSSGSLGRILLCRACKIHHDALFPSTQSTQLSLLPSQKSTGGPQTDTATRCGCATLLHRSNRSWLQNAMQNLTSQSGSRNPNLLSFCTASLISSKTESTCNTSRSSSVPAGLGSPQSW